MAHDFRLPLAPAYNGDQPLWHCAGHRAFPNRSVITVDFNGDRLSGIGGLALLDLLLSLARQAGQLRSSRGGNE